jgi:NAD(P)-dependent dehydrogenase (short-subunit alcohol dehydrogenase family)
MKATEDGFEWHVGVNHLGHFALVADLWEQLSPQARIVSVASVVARRGQRDAVDLANSLDLSPGQAYANSKLLNLAFALELDSRASSAGLGITAAAAHPGFARASAYGSKLVRFGEYVAAQSASAGARPIVDAGFASRAAYLGPKVLELWGAPRPARIPLLAQDAETRAHFWAESERLTGRKLLS